MDEKLRGYIGDFERHLGRLPAAEREDAVREIESHLLEGVRSGTSTTLLLARLGDPALLARAYVVDYDAVTRTGVDGLGRTLTISLAVVGGTMTSSLLVPTLMGATIVFGLLALLSPVAGLARMFGATWIVMRFGDQDLPAAWSLPVALAAGILCALVASGSYWLLRRYLRLAVAGYRAALRNLAAA